MIWLWRAQLVTQDGQRIELAVQANDDGSISVELPPNVQDGSTVVVWMIEGSEG